MHASVVIVAPTREEACSKLVGALLNSPPFGVHRLQFAQQSGTVAHSKGDATEPYLAAWDTGAVSSTESVHVCGTHRDVKRNFMKNGEYKLTKHFNGFRHSSWAHG